MDLKYLFDDWGRKAGRTYDRKQWLLSKWEVCEGVEWPQEKIELMIKSIVRGLDLQTRHHLVDLGCGGGWIMSALKPCAGRVLGLDFSLEMLGHAREILPGEALVCGELGTLPFRDGGWDRALSYFVFLNFMDDVFVDQCLRDVVRILKKGGRALIGQLPDITRSKDYDLAKQEYLDYCRKTFVLGPSHRDVCRAPQKLFSRERLASFLDRERIEYEMTDSFNPFYRPGQMKTVPWRFDLILKKS